MSEKYMLVGKKAVPCDDLLAWAKTFESKSRVVAKTRLNDAEVSTVFLGLDHNFGGGRPLLFETMVFGGLHDSECERYGTWEEAEAGHQQMIKRLQSTVRIPDYSDVQSFDDDDEYPDDSDDDCDDETVPNYPALPSE